jgi:hypothetical protein
MKINVITTEITWQNCLVQHTTEITWQNCLGATHDSIFLNTTFQILPYYSTIALTNLYQTECSAVTIYDFYSVTVNV